MASGLGGAAACRILVFQTPCQTLSSSQLSLVSAEEDLRKAEKNGDFKETSIGRDGVVKERTANRSESCPGGIQVEGSHCSLITPH